MQEERQAEAKRRNNTEDHTRRTQKKAKTQKAQLGQPTTTTRNRAVLSSMKPKVGTSGGGGQSPLSAGKCSGWSGDTQTDTADKERTQQRDKNTNDSAHKAGAAKGKATVSEPQATNVASCQEAALLWRTALGEAAAGSGETMRPADLEAIQATMNITGGKGFPLIGDHVELHEVCCGVGSMSLAIQQGGVPTVAACDTNEDARAIFKERHPGSLMFNSLAEMTEWARQRTKPSRRVIVVGGPPCTALSEAGKQRFDADASTDLLAEMMEYAAVVQADLVILENVVQLVDHPKGEALRTRIMQKAQEAHLTLTEVMRLLDAEVGGNSQRRRVFLWFASTWLRDMLGQWPSMAHDRSKPGCIEDALRADRDVDESVSVLDAGTLQLRVPRPEITDPHRPVIEGHMYVHPRLEAGDTVTMRYTGKAGVVTSSTGDTCQIELEEDRQARRTIQVTVTQIASVTARRAAERLRGGQYIKIRGSSDIWKVMSVAAQIVQLRRSDRENPSSRRVEPDSITDWIMEREPVYSRRSVGIGLRRFGEPVQHNSFLILCAVLGVRRLYGDEMWRLHGLGTVKLQLPHYKLGELAGNAVTTAMAAVVGRQVAAILCMAMVKFTRRGATTTRQPPNSQAEPPTRDKGPPDAERKRRREPGPHQQGGIKRSHNRSWVRTESGPRGAGTKRMVLLLVTAEEQPRVAVKEEGRLMVGQDVEQESRWHKEAKKLAEQLKEEVLGVKEGVVELAHQMEEDEGQTLLMMCIVQRQPLQQDAQWLQPEALRAGERAYGYALLVVQAMLSTAPPGGVFDDALWKKAQQEGVHQTHTSGVVTARIVGDKMSDHARTERTAAEIEELLQGYDAAQRDLEQHLLAKNLPLWAEKLKPIPREALMVNALRERFDPTDTKLADAIAEDRCVIPQTDPVDYAAYFKPRQPPAGFRPTKLEHLLKPWAIRAINKWVHKNLQHLKRCRDYSAGRMTEDECVRDDNQTLALGEDAYWPDAYGVPWDLRRLREGVITVLDTSVDTRHCTSLHIDFIVEQMEKYKLLDHQLRDFLLHGVIYCADLGWQIVLSPHLISLRDGYPKILDEMEENVTRNWHRFYDHIPLLPFRGIPNGARARKGDTTGPNAKRPRPLKEAGAPRDKKTDTAGKPVVSPNVASKAPAFPEEPEEATRQQAHSARRPKVNPNRPQKWPKEHKPWVQDALMLMATLVHVATILGEVVYAVGDDARNYFNHLRLHPSQYPYMGTFCDTADNTPRWIVNQVVEFGIAPASNIAQRLSNVLMHIFAAAFDESEQQDIEQLTRTNKTFEDWLKHRQSLSRSAGRNLHRVFANLMYTDDPLLLCCGAARTARMVLCWEWCVGKVGLWMANPIKRTIGVHVDWIGVSFLVCSAVAWVPRAKAVKAIAQITDAKESRLSLADYRKLLGRLANYVFVLSLSPRMMAGLWSVLKGSWDPGAEVALTPFMEEKLDAWMGFLTTVAAVTAARVVLGARLSSVANVLTVTVDACKEGEGEPGLGAFMHGLYARVALDKCYMLLPITVLEFIANVLALLAFKDILLQHVAGGGYVHLRTDAVSPAYALQKGNAKSELMLHVLEYVMGHHDLKALWKGLVVSQVFGERNTAADAISRALWDVFNELCRQLKIKPTEVKCNISQLLMTTLAKQHTLIRKHTDCEKKMAGAATSQPKRQQQRHGKQQPRQLDKERDRSVEQGRAIQCASNRSDSASEPRLAMLPPSSDSEDGSPHMAFRARTCKGGGGSNNTAPSPATSKVNMGQRAPKRPRLQMAAPPDNSPRQRAPRGLTQSELTTQSVPQLQPQPPMTRQKSLLAMSPPPVPGGAEPQWKTESRAQREAQRPNRMASHSPQKLLTEEPQNGQQPWAPTRNRGKYSFGQGNPELMARLDAMMQDTMSYCVPASVIKNQASHVERWGTFCASLGTTSVRDDMAANLGYDRDGYKDELMLLGFAAIDALQDMHPRAGRKAALPDSARSYLYAVRDHHMCRMPPVEMVPIKAVSKLFKSLNARYKAKYGARDLIRKQREPLKKWHVRRLLTMTDLKRMGLKVGRKQWTEESLLGSSVMGLIATQANTGMRKSEVTLPEALMTWNKSLLNWGSVKWKIGGRYYAELTVELYLQMGRGDYLILTPPPAKADPFCKVWGGRPVYIRYSPDGGANAAYWIAQLEHKHPVLLKDRENTPLFRNDDGTVIKANWWSKTLRQMLMTFMSEEEAKRYTPHSFRIYLACAAHESGRTPEEIQALCRWRSAESLRAYVRWKDSEYGDMIEQAMAVEIDPMHVMNLPHLEPGPLVQAMADMAV